MQMLTTETFDLVQKCGRVTGIGTETRHRAASNWNPVITVYYFATTANGNSAVPSEAFEHSKILHFSSMCPMGDNNVTKFIHCPVDSSTVH
jgi:hypothetical protein